jgi:methylmalonyl-CoA mutase N-terminal domain/subunit
MRERYGARTDKAMQLRFHTQTAGVSLTAQQPDNNVVRTALEALSAVLGGTQSLHTNALDEVFALPTERAAAIALRTQQVIAEETGVANVIDPLGGSWYVEHLTDLMEQRAEEIFARIDRFGEGRMLEGVLTGIEQGWFQQQMADAAFRYQQQLEKGEKVIVGVNKYVTDDEPALEILRISAEVEREQVAELARRRAARDQAKVDAALDALTAAATTDDNLIPRLVDAARVEATVGEMAAALKKVWGEYTEPPRF